MLIIKRLEKQLNKKSLGASKPVKGPKQDSQNRLILITLFMNCKFQTEIYLINHVSAETLTIGRMILT